MTTTRARAAPGQQDAALVAAAQGGDREAFAALLTRHRPALVRACTRLMRDPNSAEDAAQEAVLRAYLALDRLRRPERFGAWLIGIGLNVCRTWLREATRAAAAWGAVRGGQVEPASAEEAMPERRAEEAELVAHVRTAIGMLPKGQRVAVGLFYLEGLTHAELADTLGIGVGAVKNRLHKGRSALRRELIDLWEERGMHEKQDDEPLTMRVADVWRRPAEGELPSRSVVVLEELDGERRLPIWIGEFEGTAIALSLEKVELPRPGPHQLMLRLLEAAGASLREVRVSRLTGDTFYAEVALKAPQGERVVDSRPSDALALAVLSEVPIRVARSLVEASAARAEALTREREGQTYAEDRREIAVKARESWARQSEALAKERC